jgi:hypothetical protein
MSAKSHLRFDEIENVLSSLDLLALVGKLVRTKPSYWKWVIIAAHDALQGATVCVLGGTSGVGVLDKKSASTMLVWFDSQKGEIPEERLAEFGTPLTRCQESPPTAGEPLILKKAQLKDINTLHKSLRNKFSHFTPQGWSIEKVGLLRIIGTTINCIEQLMGHSRVIPIMTGNRKRRLLKNIQQARAILATL